MKRALDQLATAVRTGSCPTTGNPQTVQKLAAMCGTTAQSLSQLAQFLNHKWADRAEDEVERLRLMYQFGQPGVTHDWPREVNSRHGATIVAAAMRGARPRGPLWDGEITLKSLVLALDHLLARFAQPTVSPKTSLAGAKTEPLRQWVSFYWAHRWFGTQEAVEAALSQDLFDISYSPLYCAQLLIQSMGGPTLAVKVLREAHVSTI